MPNGSLQIKVNISIKDYERFNLSHSFSSPMFIVFLVSVAFVNITTFAVGLINLTEFNPTIHLLPIAIIALLGAIPLIIKINSKRVYQTSPFLKEEQNYTINDNGISESAASGTANVSWKDIYQVRETRSLFAFYISKIQAFILPKNCLTEEETRECRAILVKNLEPKRYRILSD